MALLSVGVLFQGCGDDKSSEKEISQANEMVSKDEYVLTSTQNKQYIVKKEGNGFIVEGAEGKVVIFDIFATWCPPCQAAAAHITSLKNKYKDDVVVIALTIEDNVTNAKLEEFKKEVNADYEIMNSKANRPLINEIALALDLGNRFPIPVMALYLDGKPINHYVGSVQEEFVESDIKRALHK